MIIIGERLNSSRPAFKKALEKRDDIFLINEALKQAKAGAHYLDLNVSVFLDQEIDLLKWAIPLLQEKVDLPLAIDSPNSWALEVGLSLHRGRPFLNSLSLEKKRWDSLIALVKEYKPLVIALCLDESGLPQSALDILELARKIGRRLEKEGIDPADVFLDPLVRPIGVNIKAGLIFLQSLRLIKQNLPAFKTVAGISNVSFGLPNRSLLNRTLLVLAFEAGLDAAIIDPCDPEIMATLKATAAIAGRDENLKSYLQFIRKNRPIKKD